MTPGPKEPLHLAVFLLPQPCEEAASEMGLRSASHDGCSNMLPL